MRIGHRFTVYVEGLAVAEAYVEDIEDGKVTVRVPETRFVAGMNVSLSDTEPEVDRQLSSEVDRPDTPPPSSHAAGTVVSEPEVNEPAVSLRDLDMDSSAIDDKKETKK